jgi:TetR/AcrR family transcriptional regulator, transcriptional repressor for nem operon
MPKSVCRKSSERRNPGLVPPIIRPLDNIHASYNIPTGWYVILWEGSLWMVRGAKQRRGCATRADIVDVARRLFSEFGYHNTGIADIQSATGLTKGAFYHHFRGKEELALAVLETAREDYAAQLFEKSMSQTTAGGRIAALLDEVAALNARPEWRNCRMVVTFCAEMTAADGRLLDAVQSMQGKMMDTLAALIDEAQQAGEASVELPPMAWAQWVMNTLNGAILARKLGTTRVNPEDIIAQLKRVLLPVRSDLPMKS